MSEIIYFDTVALENKKILLRLDYNVPLNADGSVYDDSRIRQSLPTIHKLLSLNNKITIVSHLGNPEQRNTKDSLAPVVKCLQNLLPNTEVLLIDDFLSEKRETFENQTSKQILVLENIRFYPQEKSKDEQFARELASLADVYINDAFSVCHRDDASITIVPKFLEPFGGISLRNELESIEKIISNPEKPLVAIVGGSKISTKIHLIDKLIEIADHVLIGGALANTFLAAQKNPIGKSLFEESEMPQALALLEHAQQKQTMLHIPTDVITETGEVKGVQDIRDDDVILDIGPTTQKEFSDVIATAKTIVWNGPMGKIESPHGDQGTRAVYRAIIANKTAVSLVGGGDTTGAISNEEGLQQLTHTSMGGGAMLELIEKGTLPGIEALKK